MYVPIADGLFNLLVSVNDPETRVKLLFDDANHSYLKTIHAKSKAWTQQFCYLVIIN